MVLSCLLCQQDARLLLIDRVTHKQYFRCPNCELHFLHPDQRLTLAEETQQYNLHENRVEDLGYQSFVRPLYVELKRHLQPGMIGLDYGAGPGPVVAHMLREDQVEVSLYDPIFHPYPKFLDRCYSFIYACEVVEHFFAPLQEFRKLRRLLVPNGFLAIMTLQVTSELDFSSWYYRRDPTHVVFYTAKTFHWLRQELGFSRLEILSPRLVTFHI